MLRAIVEQVENEQVEEAFHESIGDSLAHGPRIYRNTRISRFDITLPLETRRFERNSGRVRKLINPYRPVQLRKSFEWHVWNSPTRVCVAMITSHSLTAKRPLISVRNAAVSSEERR